ncbi:hypothetical protein UPYG_G00153290 [Umbra pygmaea]|uniref:C-type lectin domain-containing protein n=1 Tax=Umbra pygmaea TaxID=75934 RepID=A0ABD0XK40_UMBPY
MEMKEITGEKNKVLERDEKKSMLEVSVDEAESPDDSKPKSSSENIYVEASPGQPSPTDRPVEEAESNIYLKLTDPSENIYAEASPGQGSARDRRETKEREVPCNNSAQLLSDYKTVAVCRGSEAAAMYIKFCRYVGSGGHAKLPAEANTKLSVELKDKEEQDLKAQGNIGVYRFVCFLLSIICVILLMVITALCVKLQSQSLVCPGTDKSIEVEEKVSEVKDEWSVGAEERPPFSKMCSLQKCQATYSQQLSQLFGCNRCENGWQYFENSCYFLSEIRMQWNESRDSCQKRGGELAVITNKRVQTFLTEKGNLMYWIGLRQRNGSWVWVNNTTLGQSYWSETDRHHECGLLVGKDLPEKSWKSSACEIFMFYICQKGF